MGEKKQQQVLNLTDTAQCAHDGEQHQRHTTQPRHITLATTYSRDENKNEINIQTDRPTARRTDGER